MNKEKLSRFHSDSILEAADVLFKKQGYEKTTIEQIAKESEYSKPTLYAYFASKEEIFAGILYRYMLKFNEKFNEILGESKPLIGTYLNCCHAVLQVKIEYPVYFYGIIGSIDYKNQSLTEESLEAINKIAVTINERICGLFARAIDEGAIEKNVDKKFMYSYIWSCVVGIVNSQKLRHDYPDDNEYYAVLDKSFIKILEGFGIK